MLISILYMDFVMVTLKKSRMECPRPLHCHVPSCDIFATIQKLYRRLVRSVKCAKKARIATSLLLRVVHTNEQMKIQIFLHAYIREKVELQEMKW